jgi:GDPmannose 4,6-dehydratase
LGNLYAKRDWGHAKDYCYAMWKILQLKKPDDFVVATGKQYSVKEFANAAMKELRIKYNWKGSGINEKCFDKSGRIIIQCDPSYYRPLEVDTLLGDSSKARKLLKWKPEINLKSLVKQMVSEEIKLLNDK